MPAMHDQGRTARGAKVGRRDPRADMERVKRLPIHSVPASSGEICSLIDLFAGCGGASAGFLASGRFAHLYAADIDELLGTRFRPDT